jgi:putative spermidine/putrescine transport system permease protein
MARQVYGVFRSEWRGLSSAVMLAPLLVVLAVLVLWPLGHLLWQSLHLSGSPGDGLTMKNYLETLTRPRYRDALLWSLALSSAVAAASTAMCLAPAWLFARHAFWGKRFFRTVMTLPMSFSGMIVGFLAVLLLGRTGFVSQIAERLTGQAFLSGASYRFSGLFLAYLYFEIPRGVLTLESSLRKLDGGLEAAARSLGATPLQTFLHVVLPMIRPALLSTFAVTFSVSLGSFGVLLVLSIRKFTLLPLEIFTQYITPSGDPGIASAMSILLMSLALGTGFGLRRLAGLTGGGHA